MCVCVCVCARVRMYACLCAVYVNYQQGINRKVNNLHLCYAHNIATRKKKALLKNVNWIL